MDDSLWYSYASSGKTGDVFPLASELIRAVEKTWSLIIRRFPELRPAFFRLDDMPASSGYCLVGFAGCQMPNGQRFHDVRIRSDMLGMMPRDFLMTVYHAAVHCINYDRGANDTIGRVKHGEAYRETAIEVGLDVFWTDKFGYMTRIIDTCPLAQSDEYKMGLKDIKRYLPKQMLVTPERVVA